MHQIKPWVDRLRPSCRPSIKWPLRDLWNSSTRHPTRVRHSCRNNDDSDDDDDDNSEVDDDDDNNDNDYDDDNDDSDNDMMVMTMVICS